MARFEHPIVAETAALNWPDPEGIMITHSSGLVVRGVDLGRPVGDIDIVATHENQLYAAHTLGYRALKQVRYYEEDLPDNIRSTISPDGRFDVYSHDFIPELFRRTGRGRIYPRRLFPLHDSRYDQDEDTGIWVASLHFIEATQRGTGRPKDADTLRCVAQHHREGY